MRMWGERVRGKARTRLGGGGGRGPGRRPRIPNALIWRGRPLAPARWVRAARAGGGGARVPGAPQSGPGGGGGGEAGWGSAGAPRRQPRAPASSPPARAAVIAGGRRCARVRLIAGSGGDAARRCGARAGGTRGAAAAPRSRQVGAGRAVAAVAPLRAAPGAGSARFPSGDFDSPPEVAPPASGSASLSGARGVSARGLSASRPASGSTPCARCPRCALLAGSPPDVSVSAARSRWHGLGRSRSRWLPPAGFVSPGLGARRLRAFGLSARAPSFSASLSSSPCPGPTLPGRASELGARVRPPGRPPPSLQVFSQCLCHSLCLGISQISLVSPVSRSVSRLSLCLWPCGCLSQVFSLGL